MKKILHYLRDFIKEDFNAGFYLSVALFLCLAFWLNYSLDFKKTYLNTQIQQPIVIVYYILYYSLPYIGTLLLRALFYRETALLRRREVWGLCLFVVVAMSLDNYSINIPRLLIEAWDVAAPLRYFVNKCLTNLDRTVALLIPVILFKYFIDRQRPDLYGLTLRGFEWKPYAIMLLIMLPLIIWASFQPSFLKAYPRYKAGLAEQYLQISHALSYAIFEPLYAMRFISVEVFFRGFLVLGLYRFLGPSALMPMVTLYAFWHFGKPMGEALGSIFGGYILGVIALRSKSIFGGILIHIGVAMLMELTAYLQTYGFNPP